MHPTPHRHRAAIATVVAVVALLGACESSTPPGDQAGTAAGTRPSAAPSATPISEPTFDPATTVGDYAPGFPVDLLAAPDDTTVLASSAVTRDDDMVEISLNLATTLRTKQVVARFVERLEDAGFDESDPDDLTSSDLTAFTAFTRTHGKKNPRLESVHLGVLDEGEERLVTLSGVVRAADGT